MREFRITPQKFDYAFRLLVICGEAGKNITRRNSFWERNFFKDEMTG